MKLRYWIISLIFCVMLVPFAGNSRPTEGAKQRESDSKAKKKPAPKTKKTQRYSSKRSRKSVPSRRGRSRSGAKSYKSDYKPPSFDMKADLSMPVLYFYPLDRQVMEDKESFAIFVMLSNPESRKFDQAFVAIRFDPDVVEPMDYEDKLPEDILAEPSRVLVYKEEGIITYSAKLKEPYSLPDEELLVINWKPKVPHKNSRLRFVDYEDKETGLYMAKENILGQPEQGIDGVIPGTITILETMKTAEEWEEELGNEYHIDFVADDPSAMPMAGTGNIKLELRGPETPVRVGEILTVDIYFSNPRAEQIDNVNLEIRFDTETLQVVDYDEENWITREINIFDGDYHEDFPFDYHLKNRAYNQLGRVVYKMGISKSDLLIHSGRMATIKFYAYGPSKNTKIYFERKKDPWSHGDTELTYVGKDVLGSIEDPGKGIKNTSVTVLP